ncbi:MAG: DUF362 domain-containing protein [Provencibacterium sp.]|nr:DUF362 domain-containing protein [Provencibacterium sp.]
MQSNEIAITYGTDPVAMTKELLERVALADRIPQGARIGLKPNLVVAKPSETGATTSPKMVAGLIEYLQEHGRRNLLILEGSWVGDSTRRAYEVCGYNALAKRYGVDILDTKQDRYITRSYDGLTMQISRQAAEIEFFINLPVLKGHCQTMVTGALKNMKGCLSDQEKRHFHSLGLHHPIAVLNKILRQDFILVDSLCGDLDFEEGGNPVVSNRIFCGLDPVLIDSYIASQMGYEPEEIDYIRFAAELGVGSDRLEEAQFTVLHKEEALPRPTPSRRVKRLAAAIEEHDACSACYASLIRALHRLDGENGLQDFLRNPVLIGQGCKGMQGGGTGVGNCTKGLAKSCPGCPPSAADVYRFLSEQV